MSQLDWQRLIQRHDHQLVLSLLARGIRISRARELAHETWARLFEQHRAGLLPVVELPGLAIRQASFLAMRRERTAEPLDAALELPDAHASPEQQIELRQQLSVAREALGQCGPRAQEVFTTTLIDADVPHAELAPRLGLSVQRLRQTLCEVRTRLRAAIEAGEAS